MQVSYGHLKSPEALEPDVNVDRTTASVSYNRPYAGNNWQTTLAWGRNATSGHPATNAYLLESALNVAKSHTFFGRAEWVEKGELFLPDTSMADQTFKVGKLSLGYVYDFATESHFKFGIGGLASKYSLPSNLVPAYGDPTSYMLFARVKLQ